MPFLNFGRRTAAFVFRRPLQAAQRTRTSRPQAEVAQMASLTLRTNSVASKPPWSISSRRMPSPAPSVLYGVMSTPSLLAEQTRNARSDAATATVPHGVYRRNTNALATSAACLRHSTTLAQAKSRLPYLLDRQLHPTKPRPVPRLHPYRPLNTANGRSIC